MASSVPAQAITGTSSTSSRPDHHVVNFSGITSYRNPWPSAAAPTWTELAQQSFPLAWPKEKLHSQSKASKIEVVTPDWGEKALLQTNTSKGKKSRSRSHSIIATWLGHATALVELPLIGTAEPGKSIHLLFDPIFSLRAGPTQWTGPRRFNNPPCQIDDLPGCDAVFISHNHYDHLDQASITSLLFGFPKARYFVPLGNRSWFEATGVPADLIHELDWWEYREYGLQDLGYESQETGNETVIRFSCVPAQHNSGRAGTDSGRTLWCGWVIEQLLTSKDESSTSASTRHGAIYHAGDTGYRRSAKSNVICPIFTEMAEKFGGFDLSFIPIWRGGGLSFISGWGLRLKHEDVPAVHHASPQDAVDIHKDVKSKNTLAIHFGTFVGSEDETYEAVIEFGEGCDAASVNRLDDDGDDKKSENGRAGVINIGASIAIEIE